MQNDHLDRRIRYSLRAIRSALFTLLDTKPLDSITITDICREADVNRGTFYKYYRDVYDLLEKTEDDFIEKIHRLIDQSRAQDFSISDFFTEIFRILSENKELMQISKTKQFTDRFTQKILIFVLPQLNALIAEADPTASQEQIHFLSDYIMGGCTRVVADWIEGDMQIPTERLEGYLTGFIRNSLGLPR